MSKESEILRLLHRGYSQRSICKLIHTSDRKVRFVISKKEELGLSYDQIASMSDERITELFRKEREVKITQKRPDYAYVHEESKKSNVTLHLLWEEYCSEAIIEGVPYLQYAQFCNLYNDYVEKNKLTMHIHRKPGEICEVDWAGDTIPIYDTTGTKKIDTAYVFVGCLPFSMFMFAQASLDMKEENWINHHVDMYRYFGGVPVLTVCDNCKTAVISHKKYEELIYNKSYEEMCDYYGTVITAARVRAPKDKPSAEGSVGYLEREIIARFRNEKFTSLYELNERIKIELKKLNEKEFQKRDYSRSYVLENEEKEYLQSLPSTPYEYGTWKTATVGYNYHIAFDKNYYSVPYVYLREKVDVRITNRMIEIYHKNKRIASHRRFINCVGQYSTLVDHMPEKHKAYGDWNRERIEEWASKIGKHTYRVICDIFSNAKIEQQVYNRCVTILKLKDQYSKDELEAACEQILNQHITPVYKNIKYMIENNQAKKDETKEESEEKYAYIRGAKYYGGNHND